MFKPCSFVSLRHALLAIALLLSFAQNAAALTCTTSNNPSPQALAAVECPSLLNSPPQACASSTAGHVSQDIVNGCDPPLSLRAQQGLQPHVSIIGGSTKCVVDPTSGGMSCPTTSNVINAPGTVNACGNGVVPSIPPPFMSFLSGALNQTFSLQNLLNTITTAVTSGGGVANINLGTPDCPTPTTPGAGTATPSAVSATATSPIACGVAIPLLNQPVDISKNLSVGNDTGSYTLSNTLGNDGTWTTIWIGTPPIPSTTTPGTYVLQTPYTTSTGCGGRNFSLPVGTASPLQGTIYLITPQATSLATRSSVFSFNQTASGSLYTLNLPPYDILYQNPGTKGMITLPMGGSLVGLANYGTNTNTTVSSAVSSVAASVGASANSSSIAEAVFSNSVLLMSMGDGTVFFSNMHDNNISKTYYGSNTYRVIVNTPTNYISSIQAITNDAALGGKLTVYGTCSNSSSKECLSDSDCYISWDNTGHCTINYIYGAYPCVFGQATPASICETNTQAYTAQTYPSNVISSNMPTGYANGTALAVHTSTVTLDTQIQPLQNVNFVTVPSQSTFNLPTGITQFPSGGTIMEPDGQTPYTVPSGGSVQVSATLSSTGLPVLVLNPNGSTLQSFTYPSTTTTIAATAPAQSYLSIPPSTPMAVNVTISASTLFPEGGSITASNGTVYTVPQGGTIQVAGGGNVSILNSAGTAVNSLYYPSTQTWATISTVLLPVPPGELLPAPPNGMTLTPSMP